MEADFETHFRELTQRLKHAAIVLLIFSTLGWFASEQILQYIQSSLEVELHAVQVYEVIYARLNIAVIFGLALTLPVLFYQLLQFAKPGLTTKEYKTLRNFLPLGFLLFTLGTVFAYIFVISTALNFFHTRTVIAGITPIWGLSNTIGFIVRISTLTGLLFQIPIFIAILNRLQIVNREILEKYRAYFITTILLISALATPPDIITQVLITLPVILLYEISLRLIK